MCYQCSLGFGVAEEAWQGVVEAAGAEQVCLGDALINVDGYTPRVGAGQTLLSASFECKQQIGSWCEGAG